MIYDGQIGWLREFLSGLCQSNHDKDEVKNIVDTFRKLWVVAKAAKQNPYPRSPRLEEALLAVKAPPHKKSSGMT